LFRVSRLPQEIQDLRRRNKTDDSHIHVSIRDKSGRNIFAVTEEEKKAGGRKDAAFEDTKFLSQEAEWFLAGLLEGLSDGMFMSPFLHWTGTSIINSPSSFLAVSSLVCSSLRRLTSSGTDDVPHGQFVQTTTRWRGMSSTLSKRISPLTLAQAMWAPDTASYGYDSRAASIRILSAPGVPLPATRFEVRVPGADVSLSLLV